jgi:hypothetical protein
MSTQEFDHNHQARAPGPTPEPTSALGTTLLRVAWLAILLGLAMELLLVLASSFGGGLGGLGPFVADLVKHVSWSVFVCVGLAVGTAVVQARGPVMGFLGLISAPIAFEISRVLHKGALEALAASGGGGDDLSPLLVACHQRARIRDSGAGGRLGEPASVGRRVGTPGGGALGRLGFRWERDSLRDRRDISAAHSRFPQRGG